MIIDKRNVDHAHIPDTLDGEVLLGEGPNGDGFIAVEQAIINEVLDLTDEELEITGWSQHREVLDRMRPERHKLKKRDANKPPAFDRAAIATEIEKRKQRGDI